MHGRDPKLWTEVVDRHASARRRTAVITLRDEFDVFRDALTQSPRLRQYERLPSFPRRQLRYAVLSTR